MSKRQSEIDYAVIAINPALIMLLVGSLVFFLLELCYRGDYLGRMQFVMSCFVFSSVLLARVSIEEGMERAVMLGGALAVVMLLAIMQFVPGSIALGVAMLILIWWCSNRLTYDCTLVDESRDTSQKGLMQWIGADFDSADAPAATSTAKPPNETTAEDSATKSNWLWDLINPTSTQFAPGVWVIYFSMAALPLFGVGQAFEPSGDAGLRWRLFLYLFTYVAAGLGLLMTTSFLSLRRYLRQRELPMPLSMAGVWLGAGAVLIAVVLIFTALLPRPHAEYEVARIPGVGDLLNRASSSFAVGKEGTQDDDQKGQTESNDRQQAGAKQSQSGDGEKGAKSQDQKKSGDGEKSSSSGKKSDQGKGKSSDDQQQQNQSGEQQSDSSDKSPANDSQQKSDQNKSPPDSQSKSDKSNGEMGKDVSSEAKSNDEQKSPDDDSPSPKEKSDSPQQPSSPPPQSSPPPSPPISLSGLLSSLGQMFKLFIYGLVAIAAVYFAWKYRDWIAESWAKFVNDLKELWKRLFGRPEPVLAVVEAAVEPRRAQFTSLAYPFASGAPKRTPEQLVRYTFQALEAWGADKSVPRNSDQTAEEYARTLANEFSETEIGPLARELAGYYTEIAYGSGRAAAESTDCARRLWRNLRVSY
ncbi:DUF4129 domain-containing protein [Blastopirellula marina]|uniref:Protein-glutamine gamma-glutamyltransferase-like C-terminal domain-containing protein n=1 Tax=Blastopirellula marina DSM 3645 TaxID=314230 RepID=A4A0I8_9BACT|nr:DUF4129 domain-containing protein [Blastopirellula marina]EAQ77663.1 hypothetical protein DSM3645_01811 [Blastopirellula marina DSM 3645]